MANRPTIYFHFDWPFSHVSLHFEVYGAGPLSFKSPTATGP